MSVCWQFYRFDHVRYLELRPSLRSATTPAAFAAIADTPETCALADALLDDEITLAEARRAFVETVCCLGDPLLLDAHFARFVSDLGRVRGAEEAAELLGELLAGNKHLEPWLRPAHGFSGFLTPDETTRLAHAYVVVAKRGRVGSRGKRRRRRGGLLGACVDFARRLLDRRPLDDEILRLLGELITEAQQNGEGVAVLTT